MHQRRTHSLSAGNGPQIFRREGEYWTISYAGTTIRLRHVIGIQYVAELLAQPCLPFAAETLRAAVRGITRQHVTRTQRSETPDQKPGTRNQEPGTRDDDAARARSAVSKRIRDAVRKIHTHHPALGYHLAAGIKTGAYCTYTPDPGRPIRWTT